MGVSASDTVTQQGKAEVSLAPQDAHCSAFPFIRADIFYWWISSLWLGRSSEQVRHLLFIFASLDCCPETLVNVC